MKKKLDMLLAIYFNREPNMMHLNGLENNMLRRVRQQQDGNVLMRWADELADSLAMPQFWFASVGLSLCIGLAVSVIVPPAKSELQLAQVNQEGMNLFAMNSSYLLSSQFENVVLDRK